jgi:hypothetical protein
MTTKAKKDYSKGKIYKVEPICEHDEGDIYIGSTTKDYLSQRMVKHKSTYKEWKNGKQPYMMSIYKVFDKYCIENCNIVLLEYVNAKDFNELSAREAYYIKTLKCVNKFIPLRTDAQYRKDNIDEILQRERRYRQDNKLKINERKNQKYNCECGSVCRKGGKGRHNKSIRHQEYLKSLETIK